MLSDEWLSRYGLLENFNASVTRTRTGTRTGTGTGTWTTGVTAIALCTSCSRAKKSKQSARKDPSFKAKETVYQKESKQLARENQAFKTQEKVYQNQSKKKARENAYVRECERIKKQQVRQEKRKFDDSSEIITPRKRYKHGTYNFPETHKKDLKTIEDAIKQFHSDISIGPLYVCSCCHQTWFRKSVSMLKNTHIPADSKRHHCTDTIVPDCYFGFFPPRFLEWESFSDCVFS